MANSYSWAANKQKLARAIALAGQDATEEQVKKEYVTIGGLLIKASDDEGEANVVTTEDLPEETQEVPDATEEQDVTGEPEEAEETSTKGTKKGAKHGKKNAK